MRSLVPGRFTSAVVRTDNGDLEAQLSDGGHWQVKVRSEGEVDWRLLCVGHLDGRVLAPSPPTQAQATVRIGPLLIDLVRRRAEADGVDLDLGPREFDLLALLASEPGRLFTKDEILRELWGYKEAAATRTVDTHVSTIRRKLRRSGVDGFIVTYRGLGFKLCEGVAV